MVGRTPATTGKLRAVKLLHKCAPGDITVLTALVRDLKLTYGDNLLVGIHEKTHCQTLFHNNPHITPLSQLGKHKDISCDYGGMYRRQKTEAIHFLSAFHRNFTDQTGLPVSVRFPYPDLHLSEQERSRPIVPGRYWLVISGGKFDFTIKVWATSYFQEVVSTLKSAFGIQCVQIGNTTGAWHPPLNGVTDLRGKTDLRQMLNLIYHSDGVICGVTSAMHMAAALQRPCVCVAGSREAWWWEAYVHGNRGLPGSDSLRVPHRYLHTNGLIDCMGYWGCGKHKVRSLAHRTDCSQKERRDTALCARPVTVTGQDQAACMALITPEHVVDAVLSYYVDGTLPPVGPLPPMPSLIYQRREEFSARAENSPLPIISPCQALQPQIQNTPQNFAPKTIAELSADGDYDHPAVGGKMTIHVLLYGNYPDMHRTCLESLIGTMPQDRYELRVASTELGEASLAFVRQLEQQGKIAWHYERPGNPGKYVIMREMFRNAEHPITTKWVMWLDDDTLCNKEPTWYRQLCRKIISVESQKVGMVGPAATIQISAQNASWIKAGKWYKGRQLRNLKGQPVPNGNRSHFITGSFWCLKSDLIEAADLPDERLAHNGGDFTMSEQLWQLGYICASFSGQKQLVNWSSTARRGRNDKFPWSVARKQ